MSSSGGVKQVSAAAAAGQRASGSGSGTQLSMHRVSGGKGYLFRSVIPSARLIKVAGPDGKAAAPASESNKAGAAGELVDWLRPVTQGGRHLAPVSAGELLVVACELLLNM
jgi:hypothetical protein